ncbi:hypothetical protein B0O99DRAFT_529072 [Bisporella sp. PMI_857]|nr:hypothetical protein B0O99DRAFT_529072 [Bisporella sp. PMI_857]
MYGLARFLFVYFLGGLTFLPLVIVGIFLHAYFAFPTRATTTNREDGDAAITLPGDDKEAAKQAQKTLGEKFQLQNNHEADVAAGYFAVTREYTPGGINAAPPERTTPIGSTTVSAPSQSAGKAPRRGGNIFYVVLRHGHLMLYDDEEQIDVRHVVSLAHHNVSIFGGGEHIPEGELFIKRNALCLSRKTEIAEMTPDGRMSKPFYLFSENCSEKEDFYFALLRNQERGLHTKDNPPIPLKYDVKDIITLVQRLHSSEEHLQTRWINAIIGRAFLSLYKTPEVENFVRAKITKKISRVKTPSFLSKIVLRRIDTGEAAPFITNPRLKDLTVDGELIVEADVRYTGNFRIEVAATARIDLGARFKAREVELLLAVVLKRIEGHAMVRIKPPPSNRLWMTFSSMPKIDMTIEPIVSSRQITYTLILRQIENRIKEVVAESLVYPNWDDSPFYNTEQKTWRGGIWADDWPTQSDNPETIAAQEGDVEGVQHLEAEHSEDLLNLPQSEKSASMPAIDISTADGAYSRKAGRSSISLGNSTRSGVSTGVEVSSSEKPRALRSGSFASATQPIVGTDNIDAFKETSSSENFPPGRAIASISALSQTNSPVHTPAGSPARTSNIEDRSRHSSISSDTSERLDSSTDTLQTTSKLQENSKHSISDPPSRTQSLASSDDATSNSDPPLLMKSFGSFGRDFKRKNSTSSSNTTSTTESKRISLAAVSNAAATAKKWGWNAIQRHGDQKVDNVTEGKNSPNRPLVMGRGQPLPPPGTPLPPPEKKTKTAPIPVPKRKPIPVPTSMASQKPVGPKRETVGVQNPENSNTPPPLPKRRSRENTIDEGDGGIDDGLLVVAAPAVDSEPTTPLSDNAPGYPPHWEDEAEQFENQAKEHQTVDASKRRSNFLSSSPEEDGRTLPTWLAAQEEEARSKSTFVDEDMGV